MICSRNNAIYTKQKALLILFLITVMIAGCSYASQKKYLTHDDIITASNDVKQVEQDMKFLTSDECAGRRPGTPGNEKAGEYIAQRFNEVGLEPMDTGYTVPYRMEVALLDSRSINLNIISYDNHEQPLSYGEDYREALLVDCSLTLPLVDAPSNQECALLLEDNKQYIKYINNKNIKLFLVKSENNERGGVLYDSLNAPKIIVYEEAYALLKENIGNSIRFTTDVEVQDRELNNIVGVIRGEDNDHAVLVGAHFDHVGNIGETIWRGALDNASGVSALLQTAQAVKEFYNTSKPPYDIVFCAFNSEEVMSIGNSGSLQLKQQLEEKYESTFLINLDCLGNKDASLLWAYYNESDASKNIGKDIRSSLQKSGLVTEVEDSKLYSSDHILFTDAVCLSTLKISDTENPGIHTPEDTIDKIDITYLAYLGQQLGRYLYNDLDPVILFDEISTSSNSSEMEQLEVIEPKYVSLEEFEDVFQCKLGFSDINITGVEVSSSRKGLLGKAGEKEILPFQKDGQRMELREFRTYHFLLDTADIMLTTYSKDNPVELDAFSLDSKMNGYGEKSMSEPIDIEGSIYYMPNQSDMPVEKQNLDENEITSIHLSTVYENDTIIVRALINYPWIDANISNTQEDYIDYFLEDGSKKFIDEMAQLLLAE